MNADTVAVVVACPPQQLGNAEKSNEWWLTRACEVLESRGGTVLAEPPSGSVAARFASSTSAVEASVMLQQVFHPAGTLARVGVAVGDVSTSARDDGSREIASVTVEAFESARRAEAGDIFVSRAVSLLVARQIALTGEPADLLLANDHPTEPDSHHERVVWRPTTPNRAIRVVVAEDSTLIRAGIVALLRDEGFDVCGEAADRDELVTAVRRERPALVITDVRMPPSQRDEGLTAAMELRDEQPALAVLVLSQHVEPSAADLLLGGRGAGVGYLLKERVSDLDEFVAACHVVAAGGVVIDPLITERLLQSRDDGVLDRLTERERNVLDLMAQGRSNGAIARDLHLAAKTLEAHVRSIFTKLDLAEHPDDHRRVAAVVHYLHHRR